MIVQFLSLRRRRSEQGTSCKNQIFTFIVCIPVHKEILLFRSDARGDLGRFGISEGPDDTQRLNTERFHGTEKRCFFIQRFSGIGTENRRDTEQRCAPWGFMDKGR